MSVHAFWEDITPLARNEWICWIEDAKKIETRERRINIMLDKFKKRGEKALLLGKISAQVKRLF